MPKDTYSIEEAARATQYKYNPQNSVWEPVTYTSGNTDTSLSTSTTNSGVVTNNTASKVNSQAEADSEYIEIEFNTLEGDLTLLASPKTIKLKVGQTIQLEGVGKYLSGLYYISAVKRTIDSSSGYTHTFTVIKTGFGSSLKDIQVTSRTAEVQPTTTELKVGDKVMFISPTEEYTYSNTSLGVRVPNWVKLKVHTVDEVSSDKQRVCLKEIWSWTFVKFLKKV